MCRPHKCLMNWRTNKVTGSWELLEKEIAVYPSACNYSPTSYTLISLPCYWKKRSKNKLYEASEMCQKRARKSKQFSDMSCWCEVPLWKAIEPCTASLSCYKCCWHHQHNSEVALYVTACSSVQNKIAVLNSAWAPSTHAFRGYFGADSWICM